MSHTQFPAEKASLCATHTLLFSAPARNQPAHPVSSKNVLSFTIYPTTQADLDDNDYLWHIVNTSRLTQPKTLTRRLGTRHVPPHGTHVFAIALPNALAHFLAAVSMDEMRRSVIYMLADAAQGEDEDGLRRMRRALDPGVWNALRALLIRTRAPGLSPCISKASFMLDKALQSAQKHDYWKIDVDTALFVARNPTEAYDPLGLDKALAQVMASLYADWGAYHSIWSGREVLGTMMRLVREGRQTEAWERVDQVRQCADRRGSLLAVLPRQVVDHLLVPMVLEGV